MINLRQLRIVLAFTRMVRDKDEVWRSEIEDWLFRDDQIADR